MGVSRYLSGGVDLRYIATDESFKKQLKAIGLVTLLLISYLIILNNTEVSGEYSGQVTLFQGFLESDELLIPFNNSTASSYIEIPSNAIVSNISFNITIETFLDSTISNLSLWFYFSKGKIWNQSGTIPNGTVLFISGIHEDINSYIPTFEQYDNTKRIPLQFFSITKGILKLTDLSLIWHKSDFSILSATCDNSYNIGQRFNTLVRLRNIGCIDATDLIVHTYYDVVSKESMIGSSQFNISHNTTIFINMSSDSLLMSTGYHDIIVLINPGRIIPEISTTNNIFTINNILFNSLDENISSHRKYDFTANSIDYSNRINYNATGYINFTVINNGWSSAINLSIQVLHNTSLYYNVTINISGINGSMDISVTLVNITLGNHSFSIYIDKDNFFNEEFENNNNITNLSIQCFVFCEQVLFDFDISNEIWSTSDLTEVHAFPAGPCQGRNFFNSSYNITENRTYYRMSTPHIDLLNVTNSIPLSDVFLNLSTCYNFHTSGYGKIQINISGEYFDLIDPFMGSSSDEWEFYSMSVSEYYDKNFTIEFLFNSEYSASNAYFWYLDNITIERFGWVETAEVDEYSWMCSGSLNEWSFDGWNVDCAYDGSGDCWEIIAYDSNDYFYNSMDKDLNNSVTTDSFIIPSMDSMFLSKPMYDATLVFEYKYDFKHPSDYAVVELYDRFQQWNGIHTIDGESSVWQTSDIVIDDFYCGHETRMRIRMITAENSPEGGSLYFGNCRFIIYYEKGEKSGGGYTILECYIPFETALDYCKPTIKFPSEDEILTMSYTFDPSVTYADFFLSFNFTENNPTRAIYLDSIEYEYTVKWIQGQNYPTYQEPPAVILSTFDERSLDGDTRSDPYNDTYVSNITIRVHKSTIEAFELSGQPVSGIQINWKVTAYRQKGRTFDVEPVAMFDSQWQNIGILFLEHGKKVYTQIKLSRDPTIGLCECYPMQSGVDGFPISVGADQQGFIFDLNEFDDNQVPFKFKFKWKVIEWSNDKDHVDFYAQLWYDKDGDHFVDEDSDEKLKAKPWKWPDSKWDHNQDTGWETDHFGYTFSDDEKGDHWYILRIHYKSYSTGWITGVKKEGQSHDSEWAGVSIRIRIIS